MSAQLLEPIRSVRSTLKRLAVVRGLALSSALVLCLAMVAGTVDWFVHVDDHFARLMLGLTILFVGCVAFWQWVVQPTLARLTELQVARRIELAYPEFAGTLSSSVDFVQSPSSGSGELQERTIQAAAARMLSLDGANLVDRRPARHAAIVAGLATLLVLAVFTVFTAEAQIGLRRLVFPFRPAPWPRTTDLRLISEDGRTLPTNRPLKVVRGEFCEVLVENTMGTLPDDAAVEYRAGTRGNSRFEELRAVTLDAETTGEVGRVVLSPGRSPVYLRAVGGDHKSPWYRLDVVNPPRTAQLEVTIVHPEYTQLGEQQLPEGATTIEALVGSRIKLRARVSKPLKSADVVLHDRVIPTTLERDGRTVEASFELDSPGVSSWWIALTDRSGVSDPRPTRYELRVVPDAPPSVFIERPAGDIQTTPSAVVPIRATATDDQAVDSLELFGRVGDADAPPFSIATTSVPSDENTTHVVTGELLLRDLGLSPGDRVLLHAVGRDRYAKDASHEITSDARQILIVTPAVKAAELADSHARLLEEIQRVVDSQIRARDSIAELRIQQQQAGVLRRADLDLLKRTELDQHRIRSALFDAGVGLQPRVQRLVDDFDANGIEAVEVRRQLSDVLGELEHVRERVAVALESELASLRKDAEDAAGDDNSARVSDAEPRLSAVEGLQTEIVDSLGSLVEGAESWMRRVDVQSALATLGSRQEELNRDTADLVEQTLRSGTDADRRQQSADAARLGRRQQRLADEVTGLLDDLSQAIMDLQTAGSPAESRFADAKDFAANEGTTVTMREAASELEAGRAGAATDLQAKAAADLRQLHEILKGQATGAFDATIENLDQAELEIRELIKDQDALRRELNSESDPATTAARQGDLRTRTDRQSRQLERLRADKAAALAAEAATAMRQAEERIRVDDREGARTAADRARAALQQSLEATRQRREAVQQQASQQDIASAVAELRSVIKEQQSLLQSTQTSEELLRERGRRTRQQSRAVLTLADKQTALSNRVDGIASTVAEAVVVALTVESAAESMSIAAELLASRSTGDETQQAQQNAIDTLKDLADTFGSEENGPNGEQTEDPSSEQPEQQAELVPVVVRLKLIKSLQQRLNDQTDQISRSGRGDDAKLAALAERQQRIALIAAELLEQLMSTESSP